jgi:ornithine cyclodeaminase/alanine dehydrogenase-like protein (mu-crystallin family)
LGDEQHLYFNELQIHDVLVENILEFMEYLKIFYQDWHNSDTLVTLPKKQIFQTQDSNGDFRIMPCIIHNDYKIKAVKIIGTNEENRVIKDKICVGKSFLIHPYDNFIYAMFDVCALSSFRTAAISVLAYHLLNTTQASGVGIIGCGRIGFYTALILNKWLNVNHFYCNDINQTNQENFLKLAEKYMAEIHIDFMPITKMETVCDSIFLATDSTKAILHANNTTNIKFISSVGADADNLSELDANLLEGRTVVVDSHHSMMLGDLKAWEDQNILDRKSVLELRNFINNQNNPPQNIVFISTGIAIQDALISQFIYDKLTKNNQN